jgi:uncharacterized protein YjbI with pentapeptide repeats
MREISAFPRRHAPKIRGILLALAVVVTLVTLWIFWAPITKWSHSAQSFEGFAFLGKHLLAVTIVVGCLLLLALIGLPKWQAARSNLKPKEQFEAENEARKTLAEIVVGAVLLAGLYFTGANLQITQVTTAKNLELAQETLKNSQAGQLADRFTKATDQLGAVNENGKKRLENRLGGIYALEQIARISEPDHWPIMEILTAYVREHAPWPPKPGQGEKDDQLPTKDSPIPGRWIPPREVKPATDIQAILTVLGRRIRGFNQGEDQPLNLASTDLRGADLRDAHLDRASLIDASLQQANLSRAHLRGADLRDAHLDRAYLPDAHLEGAWPVRAYLKGANLPDAHLEGAFLVDASLQQANLRDAHLKGADFTRAPLEGADFRGAYLEGALNLTVKQLCSVRTLYQAQLDPPILEQIRQQCPQLLEKPQD